MSERRWLFAIRAQDRPGALTAVANAFSHRGVSVRMILGAGSMTEAADSGNIFVAFEATENKKTALLRVIGRLAKVISVESFAFDSEQVRELAIVHAAPDRAADVPPPATGIPIGPRQILLIGPPAAVEQAMKALAEAGEELAPTRIVLPILADEEGQ